MSLKVASIAGDARQGGNSPALGIPAKTTAAGEPGTRKPYAPGREFHALGAVQRIMGHLDFREPAILRDGSLGFKFRYRVARCHRDTHGSAPSVYRAPDGSRAEYRDINTCGNVWHCPVCAPKISGRRREELSAALAVQQQSGGDTWLLTFTHAHEKDALALDAQLARDAKAYSAVTSSRAWKAIAAEVGCEGTIRALEVTHGEWHGWHPHRHVLWFTAPGAGPALKGLRRLWVQEIVKRGLVELPAERGPRFRKLLHLMRYALDIRDGRYAAEYVAKFGIEPATDGGGRWGIGSEMARAHLKGRGQGRGPFRLAQLAAQGDKRAAMLFREYAVAFHAKRQLVWSDGLRRRLISKAEGLRTLDLFLPRKWLAILTKDLDDVRIAEQPTEKCDQLVLRLTPEQWRLILSRRARGVVLEMAVHGDAYVRALLDIIATGPPIDDDDYREEFDTVLRRAA